MHEYRRLEVLFQSGNRFVLFVRTCDAKLHVPAGRVAWRVWPRKLENCSAPLGIASRAHARALRRVPFACLLVSCAKSS